MATLRVVDRVVIASGKERRSRALTGVQLLDNGDLLVGYRDASTHPMFVERVVDDGAVFTVRSTDHGETWGDPHAVCALPGWDSAGGRSMVRTPDGEIIMFVMKARRAGGGPKQSSVHPIRSSDDGHTWSELGSELSLYPGGWTEPNTTGRVIELTDGRWLMPAYGADTPAGETYPIVAFSSDRGETWGERSVIGRGTDSLTLYDPAIVRLADGRLLAVIRTTEPPNISYQSYSSDEGSTWTAPEPTTFAGQTPFLLELGPGRVLCAYRDMTPGRFGVSASVTADNGRSWEFAGRIYEGPDWNCGYPGVVPLPDGKLFCVYYTWYDEGSSEVHGAFFELGA